MSNGIEVQKRKWPRPGGPDPNVVSRWAARQLGADGFGTWLMCPEGTPHYRSDNAVGFPMPCPGVQLMPLSGWWTAWWWAGDRAVTVDICTPPEKVGSTWSYVDLEVDLVLRADGTVLVIDEDEFKDLVRESALAAPLVQSVNDETSRLRAILSDPAAPVVAAGWSWLGT